MTHPLVSVITPTANRPEMLERCIAMFLAQDYENKEHTIISDDGIFREHKYGTVRGAEQYNNIGQKRNAACSMTPASIILHMDDDDLYAPDWITRSVTALQTSGADIVGLHNSYFYDTRKQQGYEWIPKPHEQTYLLGATLCYWRHVWERKPFPDTSHGEDSAFISNNGRLFAHGYKEGFIATVHGGNTECHKALPLLTKINFTHPLLSLIQASGQ